jgi:Heterokaryon incompatibility protein (HET)
MLQKYHRIKSRLSGSSITEDRQVVVRYSAQANQQAQPSASIKIFQDAASQASLSSKVLLPTDSGQLCDRCTALNLESLLSTSLAQGPPSQDRLYPELTLLSSLGYPKDWKDSQCSLCRFFFAYWRSISLNASTTRVERNLYALSKSLSNGKRGWITVLAMNSSVLGESFIYAVDASPSSSSLRGGAMLLDYSLPMEWIRDCQENHNYCRVESGYRREEYGKGVSHAGETWIEEMKLVDCLARSIVKAKSHHRYAALSYVWGNLPQPQPNDLISDNLPAELPQLIEDAITVTKGLRLRYLWIDRYCISKDEEIKHHQISNMDSIYRCANVTLIVAFGDSSHGIPGVSQSRVLQPRVRLGKLELMSSLKSPKSTLRLSTWNSRGWTYQEALLSRGRLIFTEDQITFDCAQMWISEGIPQNMFTREDVEHDEENHHKLPSSQFPVIEISGQCKDKIEAYTQRNFTFQTDRLNGFLGIFRTFSKLQPPVYHIWGIPVYMRLSKDDDFPSCGSFLAGLCWDVSRPTRRLVEFPSWCWTGWVGPILFNHPLRYVWGVDISLETTDGDVLSWNVARDFVVKNNARALSTYMHLDAWTFEVRFKFASTGRSRGGVRTYYIEGQPDVLLSLDLEDDNLDALHARLQTESWTCVILGRREGGGVQYAIVIDYDQGIAHRIGYLKFRDQKTGFEEVKRKIKMG